MFIDLVFIFLMVGFIAAGFFQGVIRMTILLVAFYLGVVLASFYFFSLGLFFVTKFKTTLFVGQYVAFALIMMIGFAWLSAAGLYTFRYAKFPKQLMYLDNVLGTLVALILAALFLGLFAVILWNMMIIKGGERIDLPIMKWLGGSVRKSFLLKYFSIYLLPKAYAFASPILPSSARIIFAVGN